MAQWNLTELSSVTLFDRIDGKYYLPEYISNQSTLSRIETVALPQWFFVSDGNHLLVSKHFSDSEGIPYFRGQDVNDFFIENVNPIRIPKKVYTTPMMRRSHFLSGDVLLSIVGSIGVCTLIENTHSGSFYSDNLIRIRLSDQGKEELIASYLNLLLNTTYGQMQMVRYSRGSVQQRLNQTQLAQIPVPIIKWENQLQIEDLIKKYRQAKKESKRLLDQSKTRVEQLIEEAARR